MLTRTWSLRPTVRVSCYCRVPFGTPTLTRRPVKRRRRPKRSRAKQKKLTRYRPGRTAKHDLVSKRPDKDKLNFLSLTGKQGQLYKVKTVTEGNTAPGVNFVWSDKWTIPRRPVKVAVELPYIDTVGMYSGAAMYRSYMTPGTYIGTVVSTIHRRLFFYASRHYKRVGAGKMNILLLRCASYYAITKNFYYWNRLLALLRHKERARVISAHLSHYACQMDDYEWFVHNQCCQQANWLTSRASRPRDKSVINKSFLHRDPLRGPDASRTFEYDAMWAIFVKMSHMSKYT